MRLKKSSVRKAPSPRRISIDNANFAFADENFAHGRSFPRANNERFLRRSRVMQNNVNRAKRQANKRCNIVVSMAAHKNSASEKRIEQTGPIRRKTARVLCGQSNGSKSVADSVYAPCVPSQNAPARRNSFRRATAHNRSALKFAAISHTDGSPRVARATTQRAQAHYARQSISQTPIWQKICSYRTINSLSIRCFRNRAFTCRAARHTCGRRWKNTD